MSEICDSNHVEISKPAIFMVDLVSSDEEEEDPME